jgi:hypothetical protein
MLELGGKPALDMSPHLGAEPEQQAPATQALQVPGSLRHGERSTREGNRDCRAEAHALGRERRGEQRQERIVRGLIAPQAVDSQPLVGGRFVAERVQVMTAQAHVDLHATSVIGRSRM